MTSELRSDFEEIHSDKNGYAWCQCVAWWCPTWEEFKLRTQSQNKKQREDLFGCGEFDGYILYEDDSPIGWSQVGKRDRLEKLRAQYELEASDSTYAISCFNIIPSNRGRGLIHIFLAEILKDLKSLRVKKVQAFPKRNSNDPWTGPESAFIKAGFTLIKEFPGSVYELTLS